VTGAAIFFVDFRALNAKKEPLYCTLPSLDKKMDQVADEKTTIFSILDLYAGYYGIGLDEASQPCTAFYTKN